MQVFLIRSFSFKRIPLLLKKSFLQVYNFMISRRTYYFPHNRFLTADHRQSEELTKLKGDQIT